MTAARDEVLREAAHWAACLRRNGYPEAHVAAEYCIGATVEADGFFTKTVSVWAGPYQPETIKGPIRRAMEALTK